MDSPDKPKHVTALRIGDKPIKVTLDCGKVIGLRRGKGRRFRVLVETDKPVKAKGRRRKSLPDKD